MGMPVPGPATNFLLCYRYFGPRSSQRALQPAVRAVWSSGRMPEHGHQVLIPNLGTELAGLTVSKRVLFIISRNERKSVLCQ